MVVENLSTSFIITRTMQKDLQLMSKHPVGKTTLIGQSGCYTNSASY